MASSLLNLFLSCTGSSCCLWEAILGPSHHILIYTPAGEAEDRMVKAQAWDHAHWFAQR